MVLIISLPQHMAGFSVSKNQVRALRPVLQLCSQRK